jgi:hypothetical protein
MVIIPRDRPVLENLDIYYLNVKNLLEHYQGEIGTGIVYFNSHAAEGAIFFDKDNLLNGQYRDKQIDVSGSDAIERLLNAGNQHNFKITIYEIPEDEIYYWASLPTAEKIYKDLSAEFTDLEALIKKMIAEKMTGYIDVSVGQGKESGLIFVVNGNITGGSYSWGNGTPSASKENQRLLVRKTKAQGGLFSVFRIPTFKLQTGKKADSGLVDDAKAILDMLEALLIVFESIVLSTKKIRTDFNKLLKQKFVENADRYTFLDPFACELEYSGRQLSFSGDASNTELSMGIVDSVKEMARELGVLPRLVSELRPWFDKYERELSALGIEF